jgi:hypothetical protein
MGIRFEQSGGFAGIPEIGSRGKPPTLRTHRKRTQDFFFSLWGFVTLPQKQHPQPTIPQKGTQAPRGLACGLLTAFRPTPYKKFKGRLLGAFWLRSAYPAKTPSLFTNRLMRLGGSRKHSRRSAISRRRSVSSGV